MTRTLTIAALCALAAWVYPAQANEPIPLNVTMESSHSLANTTVHIENHESYAVTITLFPGRLSSLQYGSQQVRLESGQAMDLNLGDPGFTPGVQAFHLESRAANDAGEAVGPSPSLYEPLRVDAAGFVKISYEEAFINPGRKLIEGQSYNPGIDLGGGYLDRSPIGSLAFTTQDADPGMVPEAVDAVSPLEMAKMQPGQLPQLADLLLGVGAQLAGAPKALPPLAVAAVGLPKASGYSIRGRFSLSLPAGKSKAAWGWVVRAWQRVNYDWQLSGWVYV